MKLCPMCERIKAIRVRQGEDYINDLCKECRKKITKKQKKRVVS